MEVQAEVISSMDGRLPPVTCSIAAPAWLHPLEWPPPPGSSKSTEQERLADGLLVMTLALRAPTRSFFPLPSNATSLLSQQQIKHFFFKLLRFRVRYTKVSMLGTVSRFQTFKILLHGKVITHSVIPQ